MIVSYRERGARFGEGGFRVPLVEESLRGLRMYPRLVGQQQHVVEVPGELGKESHGPMVKRGRVPKQGEC